MAIEDECACAGLTYLCGKGGGMVYGEGMFGWVMLWNLLKSYFLVKWVSCSFVNLLLKKSSHAQRKFELF